MYDIRGRFWYMAHGPYAPPLHRIFTPYLLSSSHNHIILHLFYYYGTCLPRVTESGWANG
jgi:hypothetical protein